MTTETQTGTRKDRTVELGRYQSDGGEERVLVGKRGDDGVVRIYDFAVNRAGRAFLVEEGFGSWREVAALRRDYLLQAKRLGECPMAPGAGRRLIDTDPIEDARS
jgi:hypothetical protein